MCVYGACQFQGSASGRSPATAPRDKYRRVEVNAMLCCKKGEVSCKREQKNNAGVSVSSMTMKNGRMGK
jgi:hypothetical protein